MDARLILILFFTLVLFLGWLMRKWIWTRNIYISLLTFFMTCSLFFAQSSRPVVSEINAQERAIQAALLSVLQIKAKVTLVAPKSITRSEGKAKRIIDTRKLHD